jgi:WD repeat-containing protein 48
MARKTRQRVSYGLSPPFPAMSAADRASAAVLPLANSPGGHRLGVNSLAVDRQGVLYASIGALPRKLLR